MFSGMKNHLQFVDCSDITKGHIYHFQIDKRLFNQFKAKCKLNNTNISKELTNFIKQSIKKG
jgi:hypothetical protein